MNLTELEFKIYSNALVRIGEMIGRGDYLDFAFGQTRYVKIPIESFFGANTPCDFVIFDRKNQMFTKIQYDKFIDSEKFETFEIDIPRFVNVNLI